MHPAICPALLQTTTRTGNPGRRPITPIQQTPSTHLCNVPQTTNPHNQATPSSFTLRPTIQSPPTPSPHSHHTSSHYTRKTNPLSELWCARTPLHTTILHRHSASKNTFIEAAGLLQKQLLNQHACSTEATNFTGPPGIQQPSSISSCAPPCSE